MRTALVVVLVFTVATLISGGYGPRGVPVSPTAVLVPCADGPTCAVPATHGGPARTVTIHWTHTPPVGPSSDDPGATL